MTVANKLRHKSFGVGNAVEGTPACTSKWCKRETATCVISLLLQKLRKESEETKM